MDDRKALMHRIQICDFALDEVKLFLDTHPRDTFALEYYAKYLELSKKATAEYVQKFGPLTPGDYDGGPCWRWVDNPWPWEMEG